MADRIAWLDTGDLVAVVEYVEQTRQPSENQQERARQPSENQQGQPRQPSETEEST